MPIMGMNVTEIRTGNDQVSWEEDIKKKLLGERHKKY